MSLAPIIQTPIIKLCTTKAERNIVMAIKQQQEISKKVKILFPIVVTFVAGIIAPISVALIGLLMFDNLIKECAVLGTLAKATGNELSNLVTLLLGITVGSTMEANAFLNVDTLFILGMGVVAFIFDTAGGVFFAKIINLFLKEKINPMIGAAGISAFPMSARVVAKMALAENKRNYIIMHAIGANASGQIGSVIAGGLALALIK